MTTTINLAARFSNGQKYTATGTTPNGTYVYLDYTEAGKTYAGPMVTAAEWREIQKIQRLIARFVEADSKATDLYKETRYMLVNGYGYNGKGYTEARLSGLLDRMVKWESKRRDAARTLLAMGLEAF